MKNLKRIETPMGVSLLLHNKLKKALKGRKKRMKGKILKIGTLLCLALSLGLALAACGDADTGTVPSDRGGALTDSGRLLTLSRGEPDPSLGEEGDICLVAETGLLYRKSAEGWSETSLTGYSASGSVLTVTYTDGSVGAYDMTATAGECAHETFGEPVTVYPARCVIPGIAVKTCTECHEAFPVILPATGEHEYAEGSYTCLYCGTANYFKDVKPDSSGRYVIEDMREVPFGEEGELVIPGEIDGHEVVIGEEAFGSYSQGENETLKSVVIGEGVKEIGGHAFQNCTELESVVFPESLTVLGADPDDGTLYDDYRSIFEGCTSLKSVTFKGDVTVVGKRTFFDCSSLFSIELPDSLKEIGSEAFCGSGLESVTLPADIQLGSLVFSGCSKLSNVTFEGLVMGSGKDSERALISSSCFKNCTSLKTISLPEGIEEIGSSAFDGCSALTGIAIPASVTTIGETAFQYCSSIASLTFGERSELNSIGRKAFYCGGNYKPRNEELQTVILPEGLEAIGSDAFTYCISLKWVVIPSTLQSFGGTSVFNHCDSLQLFYKGDPTTWSSIKNANSLTKIVHYFSLEAETGCWYWQDGVPKIWE